MLRKLTIAFFSSCLFVLMAVALLFWMQREVLEQPLQIDSEQVLAVPAGSTPNGMLLQLEQQGGLRGACWPSRAQSFRIRAPTRYGRS